MVVKSNAIRPFLLWECLELLQQTRAESALRPSSSSSRALRQSLGNFTDDIPALEATFCPGIYGGYNGIAVYELFSSQGIAFESARVAPAVTATCQNKLRVSGCVPQKNFVRRNVRGRVEDAKGVWGESAESLPAHDRALDAYIRLS